MCGRGKLSAIFISYVCGVDVLYFVVNVAGCVCKVRLVFLSQDRSFVVFCPIFWLGLFEM